LKLKNYNFLEGLFTLKSRAIWLQALFFIVLVLLGKLDPVEVVIIYALETIIIGVFQMVRLLTISFQEGKSSKESIYGLFITLFFTIHYGFFVFIQTTFFFVFLSIGDNRINNSFGIENFKTIASFQGVQIAVLLFVITYSIKYWTNFYEPKIYKGAKVEIYMFQPYLRIFIQQFVAIIPAFFIIFGQAGIAVALVLIIIRLLADLAIFKLKADQVYFQKAVDYLYTDKVKNDGKTSRKDIEDFLVILTDE
jgi:hypothetical protein